MQNNMRILGIDPGYERLGIACIEKDGSKETLIYSNCFKTPKELLLPKRLHLIGQELDRLCKEYKPNICAIEDLFFNNNQTTAMGVSQVRGIVSFVAQEHGAAIVTYTPSQIKDAVVGYGKGSKRQVQDMVTKLIHIEKSIKHDDEYDAIAVALTCSASTH